MAHPGRLELPTCGLEDRCSIQLSYRCVSSVSEALITVSQLVFPGRFLRCRPEGRQNRETVGKSKASKSVASSPWRLLCLTLPRRQRDMAITEDETLRRRRGQPRHAARRAPHPPRISHAGKTGHMTFGDALVIAQRQLSADPELKPATHKFHDEARVPPGYR